MGDSTAARCAPSRCGGSGSSIAISTTAATTLQQAIAAHDGQAAASRNAFNALSADSKAKVIAFLQSL